MVIIVGAPYVQDSGDGNIHELLQEISVPWS